jgi:hypothetical protein
LVSYWGWQPNTSDFKKCQQMHTWWCWHFYKGGEGRAVVCRVEWGFGYLFSITSDANSWWKHANFRAQGEPLMVSMFVQRPKRKLRRGDNLGLRMPRRTLVDWASDASPASGTCCCYLAQRTMRKTIRRKSVGRRVTGPQRPARDSLARTASARSWRQTRPAHIGRSPESAAAGRSTGRGRLT